MDKEDMVERIESYGRLMYRSGFFKNELGHEIQSRQTFAEAKEVLKDIENLIDIENLNKEK